MITWTPVISKVDIANRLTIRIEFTPLVVLLLSALLLTKLRMCAFGLRIRDRISVLVPG